MRKVTVVKSASRYVRDSSAVRQADPTGYRTYGKRDGEYLP